LRLDIGGERGGKFGLVEEEEAVVRRQDRRVGESRSALGGYGVDIVPIFIVPGPPIARMSGPASFAGGFLYK
jgi:hypothetical protein